MKKLFFLSLFAMTLLTLSCSKDDEDKAINPNLVGNWSGTYDGDDQGVWTVTVSSTGNVTGTASSAFTSDSADIRGQVSDSGTLSATIGNVNDREFIGQLGDNNEAMGTWVDAGRDYDGAWEGSKN